MFARDYRAQARKALKGKWIRVTLLLLLAMVLGATGSSVGVRLGTSEVGVNVNYEYGQTLTPEQRGALAIAGAISAVLALWSFLMGSWVNVGVIGMLDRAMDGETPRARMLFPKGVYGKTLGLRFMRALLIFLWSLLLIVPGIIASYRYAMAEYLLATHPEMGVMEAIRESKEYMKGRKGRLFCLQCSFIGWELLSVAPVYLMSFGVLLIVELGLFTTSVAQNIVIAILAIVCVILMVIIGMLVNSYENMAAVAFYRDARRAGKWKEEAQAGADYANAVYGKPDDARDPYSETENFARNFDPEEKYSLNLHGEYPQSVNSVLTADETVAKDMFMDYQCSRKKMREAGVLEEYEALNPSELSEMRWLRAYGDSLMQRFDQDSDVLDDILAVAAEYEMADLTDRALQRVDRHIRQQTLPDGEILNMAGRVLALLVSGAFAENEGFARRKVEQISDMADRLEHRLNETQPEGDWKRTMDLVRQMCQ